MAGKKGKKAGKAKKQKKEKQIVGLTEVVTLVGEASRKKVVAKIDTGADKSSIDLKLAAELKMGPVVRTSLIKSASGSLVRPIIRAKIKFAGKELNALFTVADRTHMKYRILIGRNILKKGFLIDPSKK